MSAPVHAIVVAKATPSAAVAAARLRRTLEAITGQTRRVDAVTIVCCGRHPELDAVIAQSGAEGVIHAPATTGFAAAIALAHARAPKERALWLLAQDTTPDPGALAALHGALERGPSIAFAAPKLVDARDGGLIVSLGVSMTRFGRTVPLANGEYDQGQHDIDDDVLGADVRGVLVRADLRGALLPDVALGGTDEGLDMGVRARLAGRRVALAPAARVAVADPGVAGPPAGEARRAFALRTAQLHRRLAYAPAWAVPLHWLSLLPLALWRTIVLLVAKTPARVPAEWGAAVRVLVRPDAVARSRAAIRRVREGGWERIAPLRATAAQLRERYDADGADAAAYGPLTFFSGGGAWAVLAALVVSIASFASLLTWPAIGGGALLPLRDTVASLWRDAAYGLRPQGLDVVGPADPFSAVVALMGSLWPVAPSYTLLVLWLLALPLAVLGGWFAATRVSDRSGVRAVVAVLWGLAPSLLAALVEGRPAAVLTHLLLPWLFSTAAVAHRSWAASGTASLLLLAVAACAPSIAPALLVLWLIALVLAIVFRARSGITRVAWLVVPMIVWFAPIVFEQLRRGTPWAILADPGGVWAGAEQSSGWQLLTGIPWADAAGWGSMLPDAPTWWAWLLTIPVGALALAAPVTARWRAGSGTLVIAALGLLTASLAAHIQVSYAAGSPVPLWTGAALSLAWLGALGAAGVTLDTAPAPRALRVGAGLLAAACVAVLAVPALTAVHRDAAAIADGPTSTLPAYVGAQASTLPGLGTLVLAPRDDGSLAASAVWGESETLGGQSTLSATATALTDSDRRLAELAGDLVSSIGDGPTETLRQAGLRFVLLAGTADDVSDAERAMRFASASALDQRAGFVRVGQTPRGTLWRLDSEPAPRPEMSAEEHAAAATALTAQLAALAVALLLAVPTRATRRAARALPRVVGGGYEGEK
ncbi:glycosyltransferase [Microbacterium sediminis]|uniref:Glycosyl transferase n=1 Tax=Microbacterium sediminis TaxID=904291 RepID=A0A1B9NBH9_9MICO|nr:glycosyltransferase [Microbacterium sediminis]OCG73894.1 glycosyl transferase [Microbacterium sediminis]QBR74644.1 glycosyl transferase [Microbacterium sediminis]